MHTSQDYDVGVEDGYDIGSYGHWKLLHALDFGDDVVMGCNVFNMCALCGMAAPSKLWWEKRNGTTMNPYAIEAATGIPAHSFLREAGDANWKCLVEWGLLDGLCQDEEEANVQNKGATKMKEDMVNNYSEDWRTLPIVGCGRRKFRPWANGCSTAVEFDEQGLGYPKDFKAMAADRLPEVLDNAEKKAHWMTMKTFMKKSKNVNDLFKMIPVMLPMTHRLIGPGECEITGISQYPNDKWKAMRQPTMTTSMWYKVVLIVAEAHREVVDDEQMKELVGLMTTCQKYSGVYIQDPTEVSQWQGSLQPPQIAHGTQGGSFESYEKKKPAPPPPPGPPPGWKKQEAPAVVGPKLEAPAVGIPQLIPCTICGLSFRSMKELSEHCERAPLTV